MADIKLPGSLGKTIKDYKTDILYPKSAAQRALQQIKDISLVDEKVLAFAATQAVTITKQETILKFAILTGACTLNLTIDPKVKQGAKLLIRVPTTGVETLTLGTGIDGPALAGVAGKTKTQAFEFDGAAFVPMGAAVQID